jgi:hypothetical protein
MRVAQRLRLCGEIAHRVGAPRGHQEEAGIGLGHDHGLPPGLEALRRRGGREQQRGGKA